MNSIRTLILHLFFGHDLSITIKIPKETVEFFKQQKDKIQK